MNSISADLNIMVKASEKASLQEQKFHFLYEDGDDYYFINQKSFEQTNIKKKNYRRKRKIS